MKKPIDQIPDKTKINFCLAVEIISKHAGLKKRDLLKSRSHSLAMYRYMIYHLLKTHVGGPEIDFGSLVGKDHSTVVHGLAEHKNLYNQNYRGYRDIFDVVEREFVNRLTIEEILDVDPQMKSFYEVIKEIEAVEKSVQRIKTVLIESYLEGYDIKEEIAKRITALTKSA